ncbi:MAG: hypothetical protein AMXMBFR4_01420 [Candidatus Hydrogenedentota bacterium]
MEKTITTRGHPVFLQAPQFTLEDQFRENHTVSFPRHRACVLLFADRESLNQIEGWVNLLFQRYKNAVDVCGIVLVNSVPDILRPTVRFFYKQRIEHLILMDWDGSVSASYPCRPKEASVFVVDRSGQIVHIAYGEAEPSKFSEVCDFVNNLLKSTSTAM